MLLKRVQSLFVLISICLLSLVVVSCGDYKGASEPYSYSPETAQSLWIPPKSFRKNEKQEFVGIEEALQDKTLTLAEVIDVALCNNPDTTESWSKAREAASSYGQSLKKYFVISDIDADYYRAREAYFAEVARNIVYETNYGGDLELKYTLLDFGRTKATSSAALQALYSADLMHNRTLQTVVKTTMNSYYDYLSQKALVEASQANVRNAEIALDAATEKLKNGVADMSDVVQAQTKLLQQKIDLVNNRKLLATKYSMLLKTMGLNSTSNLLFASYPKEIKLYDIDYVENLVSLAVKNRPDLQAYEARLSSAKQKLKEALSKRFPTVNGSFDIGRKYSNLTLDDHYHFKGEVALTFPLFHGFYIQNGIKKAQAELTRQKAALKSKQLALLQEVSQYTEDVKYSKEAYQYSVDFLKSAKLDFDINLKEYAAGTVTIVDLINAQTAVADAQYKLINSEKQWYTSLANISYATGILTNNPEVDIQEQKRLADAVSSNFSDENS